MRWRDEAAVRLVPMKLLAFVLLAAGLFFVNSVWGPIGNTRAFGILFMLAAAGCVFAKEVPVSLGNQEVFRLRGWVKLVVIIPVLAIGVLLTLYAPEVTCLSYRYQHLCGRAVAP